MATADGVKKAIEKAKLKGSWATRDSAVKVLRKLGAVTKDVVKELLVERPDGRWGILGVPELETKGAASQPLEDKKAPKAEAPSPEAEVSAALPQHKQPTKPMSEKVPKVTITSVMERLILEGLSNKEVYEEAQKILGADKVCHPTHPAWYRSRLRKQGKLPPK